MTGRRRIGDFYAPALEILPLAILAALIVVTVNYVIPQAAQMTPPQAGPFKVNLEILFLPIMGILFYIASTFGGWMAVRVEDPAKDVNWLLVRVNPAKVIADPDQKERYLGRVVRTLFLVKTAILSALLAVQIWSCLPSS